MSACDSAKIVTALYTVYDPLSVSSVLDLLDCGRIEEFVVFVSVYRVFIFDEGIGVCVWQPEDIFPAVTWDDIVTVLRVEVLELFKRCASQLDRKSVV